MKKFLITILISISIGTLFAVIIYKRTNNKIELAVNSDNNITLFQTGVFKSEENAENYMQNYNSSIIIKDGEYYRVIIAILSNKDAIALEQKYFDDLGINYYLKKVIVSNNEFYSKLNEYETLILSSESDTYNTVNKEILKLYESSINDEN